LTTNPDDAPALMKKVSQLFAKETPSFIEVRMRRSDDFLEAQDFRHTSDFVHHYLPLGSGLDEVHSRLHRKGLRVPIRKALERGLVLRNDCRREDVSVFYSIYSAARRQLGLPAKPEKFFLALFNEFPPGRQLTLLFCLLDSQPIGVSLLLTFGDTATIEYGHTLPAHRSQHVDPFLDWHAARLASERGCRYLSFGRTSLTNAGLMMYKRRWGTQEEALHTYFYPEGAAHGQREASLQYRALSRLCRLSPPRIYHTLSRAIYRHMG